MILIVIVIMVKSVWFLAIPPAESGNAPRANPAFGVPLADGCSIAVQPVAELCPARGEKRALIVVESGEVGGEWSYQTSDLGMGCTYYLMLLAPE
jgi:hypothetical protein